MNLEIEKKFLVPDFNSTFTKLKHDFGNFTYSKKSGFWFCNNYEKNEKIINVTKPKISNKDIEVIKKIMEIQIPEVNFDFLRIRLTDEETKKITFKAKSLVNKTEQNIEYEFEVDKQKLSTIINYLKDKAFIFYYNIKETWQFKKNDIIIELSKITDLKDCYLEVETVGTSEESLHKKLNTFLSLLTDYKLKEETRNYVELFLLENNERLKQTNLALFSKDAFKILDKLM